MLTDKNNLRALEKYAIIPRMLVDATVRSLEVSKWPRCAPKERHDDFRLHYLASSTLRLS